MKFANDGWYISRTADGLETVKSPMILHVNPHGSATDFHLAILVGELHPESPEHSRSEGAIHLSFEQARELSEWLSRQIELREAWSKKNP